MDLPDLLNKKKGIIAACLFCVAVLLCVPPVQNLLLTLGGLILGRPLNYPASWIRRLNHAGLYIACVPVFFFFYSFKDFFTSCESDRKRQFAVYSILFVTAFLASSLFSFFPLRSQLPPMDSAVYLYIGRGMHQGKIPYKDMFDHKGVALYFIEYLGTCVKGYAGIYILELVGIFITTFFIYRTAALSVKNVYIQLFVTFLTVYLFGRSVYGGGNTSEEFALPCIAYANYVFLRSIKTGEYKIKDFFFAGLAFCLVLLFRVNMVAPWAFYIVYFLVTLIRARTYKTLRTIVLGFAGGVLVVLIPSMLYLILTSSLADMWDTYILFNFIYISDKGGLGNIIAVEKMFIRFFSFPCMCLLITLLQKAKERYYVINTAVFLVTLFFVAISGRDYPHYGTILLPFFPLPLAYVFDSSWKNVLSSGDERTAAAVRICMTLVLLVPVLAFPLGVKHENQNTIIRYLQEETDPDADVLVLGNFVAYNIASERYTKQRFFFQDPVIQQYSVLQDAFTRDFTSNPPEYVVQQDYRRDWLSVCGLSEIESLLASSYDRKEFPEGYLYIRR